MSRNYLKELFFILRLYVFSGFGVKMSFVLKMAVVIVVEVIVLVREVRDVTGESQELRCKDISHLRELESEWHWLAEALSSGTWAPCSLGSAPLWDARVPVALG